MDLNEERVRKKTRIEDKTSIVAITCHGKIHCKRDLNPSIFNVPEGLDVIKVTTASEGNIACFTIEMIEELILSMMNEKNNLLSSSDREVNISISRINSLIYEKSSIHKNALESIGRIRSLNDKEKYYVTTHDLGFKVFDLHSRDNIANKIFFRKIDEKEGLDMSIPIISDPNFPNTLPGRTDEYPDLLSIIGVKHVNEGVEQVMVTTQMIMQYFKSIGTTKLIIFDLSCSKIYGVSEESQQCSMRIISQNPVPFGGKKYKSRRTYKSKKKYKSRRKCKSKKIYKSRRK